MTMVNDRAICVVGLGYIGLPTAALLASAGHQVLGVDVTASVVETINRGDIHIVEPDLDAYVRSTVQSGRLRAALRPEVSDVYLLCVPTPFKHGEGEGDPEPDISYVLAAARSVAPLIKPGDLVILESTSPVGTTERVAGVLAEHGVDLSSVHVAYCPERVLPGRIMIELVDNARVIGGLSPESAREVATFYRGFVRGDVLETDARTAEMCKLVENAYRDVNIAFANELSLLCATLDINVWSLIGLANRHPRVNILQPGVGVGGHCIAVDPWFIVASDPANAQVIRTARLVNNGKTDWVIRELKDAAVAFEKAEGRKPRLACLGLAFKPDIDDLRESPALAVTLALANEGVEVIAVEPNIADHALLTVTPLDRALDEADIVAVFVRHREFTATVTAERLRVAGARDYCGALA
jgi:UDP-N-acetyl-D-mannosaminuronic acid dehydrogenase